MTWVVGGRDNPLVAIAFGANSGPFVAHGEVWRLVVSMFLHGSLLHLVLNSVALFTLGANLEAFYGPWRFLFLYLVSGLCGSVASAALQDTVSVGASGGVFGLLGASLIFSFRYRRVLPSRVVRIMGTWLLPFLVLNVVLGFVVPRIDTNAHFGGLLAGALVASVLTPASLLALQGRGGGNVTRVLAAVSVAILLLSFGGALRNVWRTRAPDGPVLDAWKYEALARMERALLEREIGDSPRSAELLFLRAQVRAQEGRWEGALADYRQVLEMDPEDALTRNNLAWTLLEEVPEPLRDLAEAERLAREALERNPEDPYIQGTWGTVLLRRGDAAGAARHLRAALARAPGRPGEETDRYLLATALARIGEVPAARRELARALGADPDSRYREEAESSLEQASQSAPSP